MHQANRQHWDRIYASKAVDSLSWHEVQPDVSLRLIRAYAAPGSNLIDVGGGCSLLVPEFIADGFPQGTVVDLSSEALHALASKLPPGQASKITFLVRDILDPAPLGSFQVWHDRAVFHFLTDPDDQKRYVHLAQQSVLAGGHLILAAFGLKGPDRCSNLPVCRYDAAALAQIFAPHFRLLHSEEHLHLTPAGQQQPFTYTVFRKQADVPLPSFA